jgi:hypothetical protein
VIIKFPTDLSRDRERRALIETNPTRDKNSTWDIDLALCTNLCGAMAPLFSAGDEAGGWCKFTSLVLRVGRSYMNARGEFTSFTSLR